MRTFPEGWRPAYKEHWICSCILWSGGSSIDQGEDTNTKIGNTKLLSGQHFSENGMKIKIYKHYVSVDLGLAFDFVSSYLVPQTSAYKIKYAHTYNIFINFMHIFNFRNI